MDQNLSVHSWYKAHKSGYWKQNTSSNFHLWVDDEYLEIITDEETSTLIAEFNNQKP